ncbi:hypothetical protein ACLBR5_19740 [Escherichia coli]
MIKISGLVGDVDEVCAILLAFRWARRGTDFLWFSRPYWHKNR